MEKYIYLSIGRLSIVTVNITQIKIQADSFVEPDKLILKFIRKCKGPRTAETMSRKLEELHYLTSRLIIKVQ
jgi:hypothetical protein